MLKLCWQIWSSQIHDCTGSCICTKDLARGEYSAVSTHPGCPVMGHANKVTFVSFSPDGTRVVSVSAELVVIWDAASGVEVRNQSLLDNFREAQSLVDATSHPKLTRSAYSTSSKFYQK